MVHPQAGVTSVMDWGCAVSLDPSGVTEHSCSRRRLCRYAASETGPQVTVTPQESERSYLVSFVMSTHLVTEGGEQNK